MIEIVSDLLKRLPLTVEKEECTGTESPSTLKCILSSSIWESLYKNVKGEHRPELLPLTSVSSRRNSAASRKAGSGIKYSATAVKRLRPGGKTNLHSRDRSRKEIDGVICSSLKPKVKQTRNQRLCLEDSEKLSRSLFSLAVSLLSGTASGAAGF